MLEIKEKEKKMKFVNFNGAVTERILWRLHNQGEKDETYGKESIATLHNGIVYVFSSGRERNYGIDLYSATNTKLAGSIVDRFNRIFHKESEIMPFIEELHKTKNIDEVYDVIKKARQTYKNKDDKSK